MKSNINLTIGGILSLSTAFLHVLIIFGGPPWYRFFGAGEGMAMLAEQGSTYPTIITSIIAVVLGTWALYAFSGAGFIRKLPFLNSALKLISLIFLLRGFAGIPLVILIDDPYLNELQQRMTFMIISSSISIAMGSIYAFGLRKLEV